MNLLTERLILRPIELADTREVFAYRSDSETNKYQGWIPKTMDDVEAFIGKTSKHINEPGTWFQLVIVEKESGKIAGDLGIHFFDAENRQVEIGCTLSKTAQHKGYATEAVSKIVEYLFQELKKHRIIASVDPGNKSSIRLMERLGFRKEAHFVESLLLNGKWVDDLVYALLQRDWKGRSS